MMSAYIVCYDLDEPGQKYECLNERLSSYPASWHFQRSVWLIGTTDGAEAIRDDLWACLDDGDKLFVGEMGNEAAWIGYSDDGNSWIETLLTTGFR